MKKYLLAIAGLLLIVAFVVAIKASQIFTLIAMGENMLMPPTAVSASPVVEQEWELSLRSVGSLEAVQGVVVTADIPGRVTEILFTAGAEVAAGDILIRQDTSSEQAQLRAAEASASLAKVNLERTRSLLERNVSSKAEFDAANARFKEALAQADNIRTIIAKKSVRAPFAGRLGIRMINIGSDLSLGAPIVSLQAIDPIYVNFSLPQRDLSKLSTGLSVRLQTDAVPNETFVGELSVINPEVDAATRSLMIQATLDNKDGKLLPGMYTNVEVILPETKTVLAVPTTSIAFATYGDSVFKVIDKPEGENGQKIAEQSFVRLGKTRGDYISILAGVELGDVIVNTGAFKLLNGADVVINNDNQPDFSLQPDPKDS